MEVEVCVISLDSKEREPGGFKVWAVLDLTICMTLILCPFLVSQNCNHESSMFLSSVSPSSELSYLND